MASIFPRTFHWHRTLANGLSWEKWHKHFKETADSQVSPLVKWKHLGSGISVGVIFSHFPDFCAQAKSVSKESTDSPKPEAVLFHENTAHNFPYRSYCMAVKHTSQHAYTVTTFLPMLTSPCDPWTAHHQGTDSHDFFHRESHVTLVSPKLNSH